MGLLNFFFILIFYSSQAAETRLCEHIFLKEGKLILNKNEQVLICGSNKAGQPWQSIPLPQAELHLKSILQNIGYLHPRFQREKEQLLVWTGPESEIKELQVEQPVTILNPAKKRKVVGEALTSEKLNEVESWANLGFRSQGYACPEIQIEAQAWNETVRVKTKLDSQKKIDLLIAQNLEGLNLDVLDRYRPFEKGDLYDIRETQIMVSRLIDDGLFQSAFFEIACGQNEVALDLKTTIGKPKILRFGIGASTEELPFADLTFRNTRLDNKASSVTMNLHISPRLQRFLVDSQLYWFPGWHRTFFGPRFRMTREIESAYQTDSGRLGADLGRRWDMWKTRFVGKGGPTLNWVKTSRGRGPEDARYSSLEASLALMNHLYESSIWQQEQGWTASIFFRGQAQGLGSRINVNHYEVDYKYLWNIGHYAPPLWVLGTRIEGITVDASEVGNQDPTPLIPIEDRVFAGGDQNLRGFPRKSINNQGLGYLSFLYLGFELRLIEELPYHLQPFLLWDIGQVGKRRYTVDPPIFTSEGIGLRWLSPFGTVRSSLAQGRIFNRNGLDQPYPEQWVFFFSFGQEF
ncbi:MAG TPA: BamA/TamA family outer membrane protein [Pseudobdellovibrionaceae bacterium]|jgi:outer membrane translocation and assembly module TamA